MLKRKIVSFLSLLMLLTLMVTQSSDAYSLEAWRWEKSSPDSTLYVFFKWGDRIDTPGSVIRNGFEAALSDWHSKQTDIRYNSTSSSNNILNSYYLASDTEYGYCEVNYNPNTGYINYFHALVNAGNTNISKPNVAQSTAAHELGHSYGLGHSTATAVMNTSRDRTKIYTAQTDDLNGFSAIYD